MPELAGDFLGLLAIRGIRKLLNRWRRRGSGTVLVLILSLWEFIFNNWARIPGLSSSPTSFVTRYLTSSIIVQDARLKSEVLNWVAVNVLVRQQTRVLNACSAKSGRRPSGGKASSSSMNNIRYLPALRNTMFFYQRRPFCLQYDRSRSPPVMDYDTGVPVHADREMLKIVCLGRSAAPIKGFLAACRAFAKDQKESFVVVRFSSGGYSMWDQKALMPIRPLETIHLGSNIKSDLLADVRNYLEPRTRRFYVSKAIPYRRGYLFYGPPGTGKTSLAIAIAGFVGLPLYMLRLPSVDNDRNLASLFNQLDPWCIVLLEDIDAVAIHRGLSGAGKQQQQGKSASGSCTLSGLLNVLDGVTSQEGRIVIMTANAPDSLDEALIRRGRIDKEVYLGYISTDSARQMFMRMTAPEATADLSDNEEYGTTDGGPITMTTEGCDSDRSSDHTAAAAAAAVDDVMREKLSLEFSNKIPENTLTPAQLQEYLLCYRGDPTEAASNISAWIEKEMTATVVRKRKKLAEETRVAERVDPAEDVEKTFERFLQDSR